MKKLVSLFVCMFVTLALCAQTKPAREDLQLGSQMPEIKLESSVYGTFHLPTSNAKWFL